MLLAFGDEQRTSGKRPESGSLMSERALWARSVSCELR
jgi:hypothetical protein